MDVIPICWVAVTVLKGLEYIDWRQNVNIFLSIPRLYNPIAPRSSYWMAKTQESLSIPLAALVLVIVWASVYYTSVKQTEHDIAEFDKAHRAGLAIVTSTGFDFCGCSMHIMRTLLQERKRARVQAGLAPSVFESHLYTHTEKPNRDLHDRHDAWDDFKFNLANEAKLGKKSIPHSCPMKLSLILDPMGYEQLVGDRERNFCHRFIHDRLVAIAFYVQIDALISCGGPIANKQFPFCSWGILLLQTAVIVATKWYTNKRIAELMPQKYKLKMGPNLLRTVQGMKDSVSTCTDLQKIFNDLPLKGHRVIWAVHRMHSFTGAIPNPHD